MGEDQEVSVRKLKCPEVELIQVLGLQDHGGLCAFATGHRGASLGPNGGFPLLPQVSSLSGFCDLMSGFSFI